MDEAQAAAGIVMTRTLRQIKRVIVGIVGTTVLLIGVALLVLPGPAFIVIPLGLGILATEFLWARRLLSKVKDKFNRSRKPH
jgi:tellurite resistance protein TerC